MIFYNFWSYLIDFLLISKLFWNLKASWVAVNVNNDRANSDIINVSPLSNRDEDRCNAPILKILEKFFILKQLSINFWEFIVFLVRFFMLFLYLKNCIKLIKVTPGKTPCDHWKNPIDQSKYDESIHAPGHKAN